MIEEIDFETLKPIIPCTPQKTPIENTPEESSMNSEIPAVLSMITVNKINHLKLRFKNESLVNYNSIYAMSRSKIFFYSRDKVVFTIVDDKMTELTQYEQANLDDNLELKDMKSINGTDLFVTIGDSKMTYLAHYDDKFHKLKSFDIRARKLHYISSTEIILYSTKNRDTNIFAVLNKNLSINYTFGQRTNENSPFYLSENEVEIIGTNSLKIVMR